MSNMSPAAKAKKLIIWSMILLYAPWIIGRIGFWVFQLTTGNYIVMGSVYAMLTLLDEVINVTASIAITWMSWKIYKINVERQLISQTLVTWYFGICITRLVQVFVTSAFMILTLSGFTVASGMAFTTVILFTYTASAVALALIIVQLIVAAKLFEANRMSTNVY